MGVILIVGGENIDDGSFLKNAFQYFSNFSRFLKSTFLVPICLHFNLAMKTSLEIPVGRKPRCAHPHAHPPQTVSPGTQSACLSLGWPEGPVFNPMIAHSVFCLWGHATDTLLGHVHVPLRKLPSM